MKELLALACVLALSSGQFTCPRGSSSECLDGDYANPLNCSTYYSCHFCLASLRLCPANLHFSPLERVCDWPWLINCVATTLSTSTSTSTTSTSTSTSSTATPTSNTTTQSPVTSTSSTTGDSTTTTSPTTATTGTTTSPFSTTPPEPTNNAFAAALTYDVSGVLDPVIFDRVEVNTKGAYSNGYFTTPEAGVYFFHTSVGAYPSEGVSYVLNGSPYRTSILRTSTNHDGPDTMGRDIILEMTSQERLSMVSEMSGGVWSDGEFQTSWSGVSLTGAMTNVVAFCASRVSAWPALGRIALPSMILNRGGGFDEGRHVFRAPVDGIYYLTYSAGSVVNEPLRVNLVSDRQGSLVEIWRDHTSYVGEDVLSRSTLVEMTAGEEMWIELRLGYIGSTAETRAISFCGFLYEPKSSPVAWSVHRHDSWISAGERYDFVDFQDVLVNEGRPWNSTTNTITIPRTGVYFVHANVGAISNRQVNFNLVYNGVRSVGDVFRGSVVHDGVDTLGRGIINTYSAGDTLYINASPGTGIYSDPDRQTSFSGMLLFET